MRSSTNMQDHSLNSASATKKAVIKQINVENLSIISLPTETPIKPLNVLIVMYQENKSITNK
jgi:hypothetical protein